MPAPSQTHIRTSVEAEVFNARLQEGFEPDPLFGAPQPVMAAVDVVPANVPFGEVEDVKYSFPRDMRPMLRLSRRPRRPA